VTWGSVDKLSDQTVGDTSLAKGMDTHLEPGKSAPTDRAVAAGVNDPYIARGAVCDADPEHANCILDPLIRKNLIDSYQHRVDAAQLAYLTALTQLRVDELLVHDDNDAGWFIGLLISLASGYVTLLAGAAMKIFSQLNTAARAAELAAIGPTKPITAAFTMEKNVDTLMSNIAGTARTYGIPAYNAAQPGATAKAKEHSRTVSYLDQLTDGASRFYQQLREFPPGHADDAQMIGLWKGMESAGHDVSTYKEQVAKAIAAFKQSKASYVGVRETNFDSEATPMGDETEGGNDHGPSQTRGRLTTRVVWLTMLTGKGSESSLCYYDDRLDAFASAVSRGMDPRNREHEFHLAETVEPEFMQVAIDRHKAAFGEEPKAMIIDMRDPMKPRMVVDPFKGGKVPSLQLGNGS